MASPADAVDVEYDPLKLEVAALWAATLA